VPRSLFARVGTGAFARPGLGEARPHAAQRFSAPRHGFVRAIPSALRARDREGHDFSPEPALSKRSAPKGAVNAIKSGLKPPR
jgi:hypothetical protein